VSGGDVALDVLIDFLNTVEAGVAEAKKRLKMAEPEGALDLGRLFWEQKMGVKGPFEQTSEKANNNSALWQQLRAKLKEHDGFWQNNGFRYWFDMKNEQVVDRRRV